MEDLVRSERTAFTLLELLVVVAIIGVLVALLLPALNKARSRAAMIVCASNVHQTFLALEMYADSNDDFYPRAINVGVWGATNDNEIGWMQRIYPFAKRPGIYRCPGQPQAIENDYSYFLGSRAAYVATGGFANFSRKALGLPDQYILAGDNTYKFGVLTDTDKDNYTQDCLFDTAHNVPIALYHFGRVNLLFGDGHVRAYNTFLPGEMTYAYDQLGINWNNF